MTDITYGLIINMYIVMQMIHLRQSLIRQMF